MKSRHLAAGAVATFSLAALTVVSGPPAGPQAHAVASTSPIKHVVVIYQENHSFDDVLGDVCETRATRCNGYTGAVTFADGVTASNIAEPDVVPQMGHSPQVSALGIANKWDKIAGCSRLPYPCVTHYPTSAIPNLATLADRYTVSDATFAAGGAASFGAHLNLGSGTMDGFIGYNPANSTTGVRPGPGWGCNSNKDARWGTTGTRWVPSCVPDATGAGPYRTSPVPYTKTIMQDLESAGLTWHTYIDAPSGKHVPSSGTWSVCTYFAWCLKNRFTLNFVSTRSDFYTAAAAGTLPNVTMMLPVQSYSQHNNASMAVGDNYIGQVVQAIQDGPQWASTAIFITYDDCGCFYDHVTPPSNDLGMRNPMVIVSPYAKPGYTDSTTAVQPYSMLTFIDHTFDLPALTPAVGAAYDYSNSFDFTQTPLRGTPMVHTHVSIATKRQVAAYNRLHPDEDDPT
jgi:phospholipase C